MRILLPCLLVLSLAVLPACQMNERLSGTLMGGVGGGVVGGFAGGAVGAVVGVAAGAIVGYLVGDYIADGRERGRPDVFGSAPAAAQGPVVLGVKTDARKEAARAAYERGRSAKTAPAAKEAFETSIGLDPTRPEPYNALALNALYRGDRPEAERLLRESLARDPAYHPAQHNLRRLQSGAPIVR